MTVIRRTVLQLHVTLLMANDETLCISEILAHSKLWLLNNVFQREIILIPLNIVWSREYSVFQRRFLWWKLIFRMIDFRAKFFADWLILCHTGLIFWWEMIFRG